MGRLIKLINIHAVNDQILSFFGHTNYGGLKNAINIAVKGGHLDLIHNKNIFEIYTKNHSYNASPQFILALTPILTY